MGRGRRRLPAVESRRKDGFPGHRLRAPSDAGVRPCAPTWVQPAALPPVFPTRGSAQELMAEPERPHVVDVSANSTARASIIAWAFFR